MGRDDTEKSIIGEAYATMCRFLDFYFGNTELMNIMPIIDDKIYFAGIGREGTVVGRRQFQELIEEGSELQQVHSDYEILLYDEEKMEQGVLRCLCKVRTKEPISYILVTALLHKQSEAFIIAMLHVSRTDETLVEMKGYIHNLLQESSRDFLTGIYNRRGGEERIRKEIKKGIPFVFLMMDLDDFKKVNDIYGHRAGDRMLCYMGEKLQEYFRKTDILIRLGGDEFAVFAQPCLEIAAIKKKVNQLIVSYTEEAQRRYPLSKTSVSVGGVYGKNPGSFDEIYHSADQILYTIKQSGKRRCEFKESFDKK